MVEHQALDPEHGIRDLQDLALRLWPAGSHPGGLAWEWAIRQLPEITLFREDGDLIGWVAVYRDSRAPNGEAFVHMDRRRRAAVAAATEWLAEESAARDLVVAFDESDSSLGLALEAMGFAPDPALDPWTGLWLAAEAPPAVSSGYEIRPVRPGEFQDRVEIHRAAWLPADLPYAPGHRPDFAPDATSSFTAAGYARVQKAWPYEPELDLVAVAPDGSFAACCLGWPLPEIGTVEIEPLGVAPGHRRRGLAGALCLVVAERARKLGCDHVFINTGPMAAYPAPAAAYSKVGFEVVVRGRRRRRAATS